MHHIAFRNPYSHSAELFSKRKSSVMNGKIQCSWCGRKEVLEKQRVVGRRPGSEFYFIHYECELGHRFHNIYPTDSTNSLKLRLCDCSTEASVPITAS